MIVVLASAFLVVSYFVARWLTADNRERNDVTELLDYQARGDAAGMLGLMPACSASPACRSRVRLLARRFAGGGEVKILRYDSGTARSLGAAEAPTRVAWQDGSPDSRIWVQCVQVTRSGVAFLGGRVALDSIGAPIDGEASCPG